MRLIWLSICSALAAACAHPISNEPTFALTKSQSAETWLCSGQSNMVYSISRSERNAWDRGNLNHRLTKVDVRLATLDIQAADEPQVMTKDLKWIAANADSAGQMSALCLLHLLYRAEQTNKPMRGIVAARSGSRIEPWVPITSLPEILEQDPATASYLDDPARALAEWQDSIDRSFSAQIEAAPQKWSLIDVPGLLQSFSISSADRLVEFRSRFQLDEVPGAEVSLALGRLDDWDITRVNDCEVGRTHHWNIERLYKIPNTCLRQGENNLTVILYNRGGPGGFHDPDNVEVQVKSTAAQQKLAQLSDWHIRDLGRPEALPPKPGDESVTASLLFNGMIAPLRDRRIDGVLWYQGESNALGATTASLNYTNLLKRLVQSWREHFSDSNLEFLIVQQPEFDPVDAEDKGSFGRLRSEQWEAVQSLDNAVLVSSLGLGNPDDIHPVDKSELAWRTARAPVQTEMLSLQKLYDEDASIIEILAPAICSGTLKVVPGLGNESSFELCQGNDGSCTDIEIIEEEARIFLHLPKSSEAPAHWQVRFGFKDTPDKFLSCEPALAVPAQSFSIGG